MEACHEGVVEMCECGGVKVLLEVLDGEPEVVDVVVSEPFDE